MRSTALGLVVVALAAASGAARAEGRVAVDVVVPDPSELEAMAFWVARGAGFFEAAGVEVQVGTPEVPARAVEMWQSRRIPAAVFGPAELLELAKHGAPAAVVAQLFDHGELRALCFDQAYADKHPEVALGMTRAVYRAEKLVHADPGAATNALMMAFPAMERRRVEEALRAYAPRIPADPRVSRDDLRALGAFAVPPFADEVVSSASGGSRKPPPPAPRPSSANLAGRVAALVGLTCVVLAWIVVTVRRRLGGKR